MFKKFLILLLNLLLLTSCTTKNDLEISFPVSEEEQSIIIEIKGAVKNPGLYSVSNGIMLFELIDLAGGLLSNADTDHFNLTQSYNNNASITIPFIDDNNSYSKLININIATIEELMTLQGIGEAKALAIIDYRNNNYFNFIEDIMKVSGISESIFNKIKNNITV